MDIIEQKEFGLVSSPSNLARLNIIDWNRYKPYWKTPMHAIDSLGSWFIGFRYSVWSVNLYQYLDRDDFPEWNHVGGQHGNLGRLYWNFFHDTFEGEIHFHDQPDLSGYIYRSELTPKKRNFWGDIGKVSPITMREMSMCLHCPDMWISVIDEYTQVILEAPPSSALNAREGKK